jgi:hypothetical protein
MIKTNFAWLSITNGLNTTYYFGGGYKCDSLVHFQVLLLQKSTCFNIVSCKSFNQLIEFPKPISIWLNSIPMCIDSLVRAKQMFQMSNATTHSSDVAWSQNTRPPSLHLEMILTIVFYNWNKDCSIRANDPLGSWIMTPLYALGPLSSMAMSPLISMTLEPF